MHTNALAHVSDEKLLADLHALVAHERAATVTLLAHLAEVDARELYKPTPYPSMFAYCTRVLLLAEAVAYKRIRAARIARKHPQLLDAIADGRVHVTGVAMLAPHITAENVDELNAAATHRSKHELEVLVARLAPRPDVPSRLRRLPAPPALPPADDGRTQVDLVGRVQLDPDPVPAPGLEGQPGPAAATPSASDGGAQLDPVGAKGALDPDPVAALVEGQPAAAAAASAPTARAARARPLAPERYALQATIDQATRDKVERAKALLSHQNPTGDLAVVIDRALDALLEKLEKAKFGATSKPRARKARPEGANPRYTQNADRREIHERDGEQCAWISPDGVRCTERVFLQLDHKRMVCRGGGSDARQMGILCHAHNQYEAERQLGAAFMREKREQARAARAAKTEKKAQASTTASTSTSTSTNASSAAGAELSPDVACRPDVTRRTDVTRDTDVTCRPDVTRKTDAVRTTDVELALRGMGYKATEARNAMTKIAPEHGTSFDQRLEAALAILTRSRCSEVGGVTRSRRSEVGGVTRSRGSEAAA